MIFRSDHLNKLNAKRKKEQITSKLLKCLAVKYAQIYNTFVVDQTFVHKSSSNNSRKRISGLRRIICGLRRIICVCNWNYICSRFVYFHPWPWNERTHVCWHPLQTLFSKLNLINVTKIFISSTFIISGLISNFHRVRGYYYLRKKKTLMQLNANRDYQQFTKSR